MAERAWALGGAAGLYSWVLTALAALSFTSRSSQPRTAARVVSRAATTGRLVQLKSHAAFLGPPGRFGASVELGVAICQIVWINKGVMGLLCLGPAHSRHSAEVGPAVGAHRTLNPELRLGLETTRQCCVAPVGEPQLAVKSPAGQG